MEWIEASGNVSVHVQRMLWDAYAVQLKSILSAVMASLRASSVTKSLQSVSRTSDGFLTQVKLFSQHTVNVCQSYTIIALPSETIVHCLWLQCIYFTASLIVTHANGSGGSIALNRVCLWFCVCVCSHDNSKTNDPKVFKLGILGWPTDCMVGLQKHILGDRVAGVSLHSIEWL